MVLGKVEQTTDLALALQNPKEISGNFLFQ